MLMDRHPARLTGAYGREYRIRHHIFHVDIAVNVVGGRVGSTGVTWRVEGVQCREVGGAVDESIGGGLVNGTRPKRVEEDG